MAGTAGSVTVAAGVDTELLDFTNHAPKGCSTIKVTVDSGDCSFRVPALHATGDYAPLVEGECDYFSSGKRDIHSCIANSTAGADIRYWVAVGNRE